ncbi:MAG: hypothetical protein AAF414_19940 [Pseudomonadota bacterium]
MRAMTALVKREYREHRIAFVIAPAVLLTIVTVAVVFAILFGFGDVDVPAAEIPLGAQVYRVATGGAFALWSAYLLIGLFFYYADSFSADRRNNALLFWKSMPQSDLKILTSKALSGLTIFLAIIACFALLTSVLIYVVLLIASTQAPIVAAPGLIEALWSLVQMGVVGAIFLALTVLWYAPGLAWVAGLSTLFRRWSIPLAILIPGTAILLEYLNSLRATGAGRPIADFLGWRFETFMNEEDAVLTIFGQADRAPFALLSQMLGNINWLHMAIGWVFTAAIVYLASEYRRRRIEA